MTPSTDLLTFFQGISVKIYDYACHKTFLVDGDLSHVAPPMHVAPTV
jgi:hypothetical protein